MKVKRDKKCPVSHLFGYFWRDNHPIEQKADLISRYYSKNLAQTWHRTTIFTSLLPTKNNFPTILIIHFYKSLPNLCLLIFYLSQLLFGKKIYLLELTKTADFLQTFFISYTFNVFIYFPSTYYESRL